MTSSRNHAGDDGDDGDAMQYATQNNPIVPVQEPNNSIKDSGKDGATLLDNGVVGVVNEVNEVDEHENNNNGGSATNGAAVDANSV